VSASEDFKWFKTLNNYVVVSLAHACLCYGADG